jgi:hypothetical protein
MSINWGPQPLVPGQVKKGNIDYIVVGGEVQPETPMPTPEP